MCVSPYLFLCNQVDEYDIARNLEVISPEGLPHASSSSKSFSLKYGKFFLLLFFALHGCNYLLFQS
jgi:type III secretory pathway lipoprotein EscJ